MNNDHLSKDDIIHSLPKPNPLISQWWFDNDTIDKLGRIVWEYCDDNKPPAFLGTPTVGYFYSIATGSQCTVLDKDERIL